MPCKKIKTQFSTNELKSNIEQGLETALFGNSKTSSLRTFRPELIVNHDKEIVLSTILNELETCESFDFSVAFITSDGLACLIQKLHECQKSNIHGRILTGNYLNFTEPGALSKILQFPNIELRVYTKGPFHPKGYIFKQSNYYSLIVGSSNLTHNALNKNQEWNLRMISLTNGQLLYSTRSEFKTLWEQAEKVDAAWLNSYTKLYFAAKLKRKFVPVEIIDSLEDVEEIDSGKAKKIIPNKMQNATILSLNEIRSRGESKSILIAATGTGKTYLAAFDVLQVQPKKVLYIVNRETILRKAEESFKNILGSNIKTGFLTGNEKSVDCDYLFASCYTLSKDETLNSFKKDEFDYIIIDEVHHSGATTYQKIIDYFTPKFLLGLTATPERSDGFDIFQFFDYNIASEIRLKDALEADLLCPFHYYGVTDLTINNEEIDDKTDFNKLICDERINHIIHAIWLYSNNSESRKGLIFVSRKDEGKRLSEKLNEKGLHTIFLSGEDDEQRREDAITQLESDENKLEYIISVDIFNEGVDIPAVNQVIMLRPTQSAIIFVQQLGRGLRKNSGKKYLTVIDFIGNYENNFMIPIALFGDKSLNKDKIRRLLTTGSAEIPGCSTIDIERIAKQKIYAAIDKANFSKLSLLKDEYLNIRRKIGQIPAIMDFIKYDGVDPKIFIDYSSSYYEFLCRIENITPEISEQHFKSLRFISLELANGIRPHEIFMLKKLIGQDYFTEKEIESEITRTPNQFTHEDFESSLQIISNGFFTKANLKKYGNLSYIKKENDVYKISKEFSQLLQNEIYKSQFIQTLEYAEYSYQQNYAKNPGEYNLCLYEKYSRKDVCRLLNWKNDCSSTIFGYKTMCDKPPYTAPLFVTYDKAENISESTKYEDAFIDNSEFSWMSRSHRTSQSQEIAVILNQDKNKIKVPLFIKKSDDEGTDFYYMGDCFVKNSTDTKMQMKNGENVSIVNIVFEVVPQVSEDIYNYITDYDYNNTEKQKSG